MKNRFGRTKSENFLQALNEEIFSFQNNMNDNPIGFSSKTLPTANHGRLFLSDVADQDIKTESQALFNNHLSSVDTFKNFQLKHRRALGYTLGELSDNPSENEIQIAKNAYHRRLNEIIDGAAQSSEVFVGCLFCPEAPVSLFEVGPIRLIDKKLWLKEQVKNQTIGLSVESHILECWEKNETQFKNRDGDEFINSLFFEIGNGNTHISVLQTANISGDKAKSQARWLTRLVICSLALKWQRPEILVTNFRMDKAISFYQVSTAIKQNNVVFGGIETRGDPLGPGSAFFDWDELKADSVDYFQYIGKLLRQLIASESNVKEDNSIIRRMLHALIWLDKGFREENDLLAAGMFACSLDAMSGSNGKENIVKTVENLYGKKCNDLLFVNPDMTSKEFIHLIYQTARNETFHGFNKKLTKDWSSTRVRGATLAREIFLLQVERFSSTPSIKKAREMHFD